MERRRYLHRLSFEQALAVWLGRPEVSSVGPVERVPTSQSRGRVTAEAVFAARSVPHYHCAAMDGVALAASVTFGASEVRPIQLVPEQFHVVDTGDPLPPETDAVVMVEDVRWLDGGGLELIEAASPWQHVRLAGEDLVATEMVVPGGRSIRPPDIAALLSAGVREVGVYRRPCVAILPTGDELVDVLAPVEMQDRPGAILETNSHMLAGLIEEWGGIARRENVVPDRPGAVRAALLQAVATADIVVLNAGSSAGRDDYTPAILAEEGELLVHGVDIMPGKPAALAVVRQRPVLALPGYPVSAWVVAEEFLRPLVLRRLGLAANGEGRMANGESRRSSPLSETSTVPALMARKTPSRSGTVEYLRVKAARVGGRLVAVPLARGAGLLNSVVRADGIVRVPAHSEGVEAGETVLVELLQPLERIEGALLAIGSHDLLLDLLGDHLGRRLPGCGLSSAHVGSLAGLVALQRGECHLAGTHLIDEQTGEYNLSWVRRYCPGETVALIRLAARQQGLVVPRGNPRGLTTLRSLFETGAHYVNRQRGSGTRQLLDYHLRREGLDPRELPGYHRELYTHLAVAAAVKTGSGDAGLAIQAVARALDLDFLPVAEEQYDLAIRTDALELPAMRALLDLLHDPEFRTQVERLGGYDLREAGRRLL